MDFTYGDDVIVIDGVNKGLVGTVGRIFTKFCLVTAQGSIFEVDNKHMKKISRIDTVTLKIGDIVGVLLDDTCEVGVVTEINWGYAVVTRADGTMKLVPIDRTHLVFIESDKAPKAISIGDTVCMATGDVYAKYKVIHLYPNKKDAIVECEHGSSPMRVALSNLVLADDELYMTTLHSDILTEIDDSLALLRISAICDVKKEMKSPNQLAAKVSGIGIKRYVNNLLDGNLPVI